MSGGAGTMEESLAGVGQQFEMGEVLAEIKAGLMTLQDGKLVPDRRKGLLRVAATDPDEPGEVLVSWHVREGTEVVEEPEEEFIGMPLIFTSEFNQVGNPKSRCYVYRENQEDRLFVWLQEPNPEQDGSKVDKVRRAIEKGTEGHIHELAQRFGIPLHDTSGDMAIVEAARNRQRAIQQSEAPPAPAVPTMPATGVPVPGTSAAEPAGNVVGASQLASILGNIMQGGAPQAGQASAEAMAQYMRGMAKAPGPSLGEVLSPEVMMSLLTGDDLLQRLSEYLPEEHRNLQGLMGVAQSPQFQQQVETFSHALQTGQLDLAQFGLDAQGFSVADFLESIEKDIQKQGN